jgi:8-oxo-dGTP diphosphatase
MERKLMPSNSVDCVIFGFDLEVLKVLLVERTLTDLQTGKIIFSDLTLTGNHIYEDESLEEAARRIVNDLTGLENLVFEQFYTFSSLNRLDHPNDQMWLKQFNDIFDKRIITTGYFSLLPTTDVKIISKDRVVNWYPVSEVKDLGYDHEQILQKALSHLRYKMMYEPVAFEMLPERFTLSQMQRLYESVMGTPLDKRNFRKKVSMMSYVVPLNERQRGVPHKPAQLYLFSREVFNKTHKEGSAFI